MKSRIAILPLLAIAVGVSASAQKLAVVDMQGAILTTKEGKKAAEELQAKFGPTEQALNKRQQDLIAKQESYRKATNADEKARLEREIDTAQKSLSRDADDARAEFSTAQNNLLGGIMQKMQGVMSKYAAEKGITMIVDVSQQPNNLLYADKAANISTELVTLYDAAPAGPTPGSAPAAAPSSAPPAAAPRPAAPKPVTPAPKTPGAK